MALPGGTQREAHFHFFPEGSESWPCAWLCTRLCVHNCHYVTTRRVNIKYTRQLHGKKPPKGGRTGLPAMNMLMNRVDGVPPGSVILVSRRGRRRYLPCLRDAVLRYLVMSLRMCVLKLSGVREDGGWLVTNAGGRKGRSCLSRPQHRGTTSAPVPAGPCPSAC